MTPSAPSSRTKEIDRPGDWSLLDCLDAPAVVIALDDAGEPLNVEFGNEAACGLLTLQSAEFPGRPLDQLFAPDALPGLADACGRTLTGKAVSMDAGFLTRAQETLSLSARARRVTRGGVDYLVLIAGETAGPRHAASARALSESRFSGIVEESADGMLLIAGGGTILYSNPAAASLFGLPRKLLVGSSFGRPVDVSRATEIDIMRADGSRGVAEMRINPTHWMGAQAYVATLRDITDRLASEGRARRAAQLQSLEMLGRGMAQDLDGLLTEVSDGLLAATAAAEGHASVLDALAPAQDACGRAIELAQELVSFASDDAPDGDTTTDIGSLIEELVRSVVAREDIEVRIDVPRDLWKCNLDVNLLYRVLESLLTNAEEALPANGQINVTAHNVLVPERGLPGIDSDQLKTGDYVRLTVEDDGVGMAEDLRARAFDPFVTTTDSGRGLGLAMTFSIASKNGGHVHVESVEGRGTTVHVFLPAVRRTPTELEETSEVFHEPIGRVAALSGRRLLVMDDDPAIREMLSRFLSTQGAEVMAVEHGIKAVARYERAFDGEERNFDAVLLDSTVSGGMGAVATLERLLEVDPNVVAVVAASRYGDTLHSEFGKHGFKAAVTKPFDLRALATTMAQVLADQPA